MKDETLPRRGFRPAERLIELANAVRADPDLPRGALAELLARHGESPEGLTEQAFSPDDAVRLRAAAARLAALLTESDTDLAAHAINALLAECGARPHLSRHGGHTWHLHVDRGDDADWADWFLASGALALAQILSEYGRVPWGSARPPMRHALSGHRPRERPPLLLDGLCCAGAGGGAPPPQTGGRLTARA